MEHMVYMYVSMTEPVHVCVYDRACTCMCLWLPCRDGQALYLRMYNMRSFCKPALFKFWQGDSHDSSICKVLVRASLVNKSVPIMYVPNCIINFYWLNKIIRESWSQMYMYVLMEWKAHDDWPYIHRILTYFHVHF